ncbi:MAG TPA: hypothetical protein VG323_13275 [Thermoanaerobaculia bacterium]|nr:hypothetical protein [Thermoanaerobaculia bacterium]
MAVLLIIVAAAAGLLLATKLSQAGRLRAPLAQFRGHAVDIRVWGNELPDAAEIESVKAIGAGLHLFLRGGHLKIAQPSSASVDERGAVIAEARYVQWRGKRIPRAGGAPAVTITKQ